MFPNLWVNLVQENDLHEAIGYELDDAIVVVLQSYEDLLDFVEKGWS